MRANVVLMVIALGAAQVVAEEVLVIENVSAIDAVDGLQEGVTVVIRGNRIESVEASPPLRDSDDVTTINGTRKYLIPGLWDSHVHLTFERDIAPAMFPLFLANGVTSIRDTGGLLELVLPLREKARKDTKSFPRVMVAGPLLDGVSTVYDDNSPGRPKIGLGAASVTEAEALFEKFSAAGVDLVKTYEMLSPAAFTAVIQRANRKGLLVTGHIPLSMDVISASNAGLRSMEHLRNLEMSCSRYSEQLLETRRLLLRQGANQPGGVLRAQIHQAQRTRAVNTQDAATREQVLKTLASNGTWQIPTLTVVIDHDLHVHPEWRDTFKYLPDSARRRWTKRAMVPAAVPLGADREAYEAWAFDMVGRMSKAGIGIMAGTDCPIVFLTPGFSLHEELKLLAQCGLTPIKILEAATLRPAQYFKMDADLGSIRKGMLADLVLLDANPLQDIGNTSKINAVVRDGKLYDRNALDQMLRMLETK